jgi:hypothetical protein
MVAKTGSPILQRAVVGTFTDRGIEAPSRCGGDWQLSTTYPAWYALTWSVDRCGCVRASAFPGASRLYRSARWSDVSTENVEVIAID